MIVRMLSNKMPFTSSSNKAGVICGHPNNFFWDELSELTPKKRRRKNMIEEKGGKTYEELDEEVAKDEEEEVDDFGDEDDDDDEDEGVDDVED